MTKSHVYLGGSRKDIGEGRGMVQLKQREVGCVGRMRCRGDTSMRRMDVGSDFECRRNGSRNWMMDLV